MKRVLQTTVAVRRLALLLALAMPGIASAAVDAYIDCSLQSNACFGDASSDSGPVNFTYQFDYNGLDAVFPNDCTNQNMCTFYCLRYPGSMSARLIAFDANYNIAAVTDWVTAMCTEQDIILP